MAQDRWKNLALDGTGRKGTEGSFNCTTEGAHAARLIGGLERMSILKEAGEATTTQQRGLLLLSRSGGPKEESLDARRTGRGCSRTARRAHAARSVGGP